MAESQPTSEHWIPVVGHESLYMVSDLGRVWSNKRTITRADGRTSTVGGRIIKGGTLPTGHRWVGLSGNRRQYVHRLVLEAFVGPCPDGMECCHYDDDPSNNHLSNLRWATRNENMLDRSRNGIDNNATKNATHCARGHEFNTENTIVNKGGHRSCRECKNAATRRRSAAFRASNPRPERSHCKRGHRLGEPNLRTGQLPRKDCKACHRAQAWASHNGKLDRLQEIADDYYARIMA